VDSTPAATCTVEGTVSGRQYFETDDELEPGDYIYFKDGAGETGDTLYGTIIEEDAGGTDKYRYYHTASDNPAVGNVVTAPLRQLIITLNRERAGTVRGSHKLGDDITEVRVLEGNHVAVVLSLLMSGAVSPTYSYDNLPTSWGAGLHEDFIDVPSFEALFTYATERRFIFDGPIKVPKLLALLSKATNCRIFWDETGKLRANAERDIYPDSAGLVAINADRSTKVPTWADRQDAVYNSWVWRGNAPRGQEFRDILNFRDEESAEFYGDRSLPDMEDGSLLFTAHANNMELIALSVIKRWSDGCPFVETEIIHVEGVVIRPGTLVAVTFPHLPDKAGGSGLAGDLYEVLEFVPNDSTGKARIRMGGIL